MIGTTIGQYQVLEKLGEGGMGVVYKARDAKLNRFVALKLLPPGTAGHRETRERFLNEARTASSLGHPNIVTIHDILEHDSGDVLVMEYIPGQTLEQILHTRGPCNVPEVIDYAGQIADALAAAHRAGLIHRDLKPGNIMITPEGRVKVVDFGLAKLAAGTDSSEDPAATRKALTARGAIIGTVAYMSPEQAEGRPLDARTDIFSYGAVLYEMLTGRRAVAGEEPLPAHTPRNLELLVTTCLKKDPNKRLQSLGDVRLLLEVATSLPAAAAAKEGTSAPKPKALLVAAVLLTALATAGITYVVWGRNPSPSSFFASAQSPLRFSPLTAGHRDAHPVLSPDGNLTAFSRITGQAMASSARTGTAADLYLVPTRGGAEVRLASGPFFNGLARFSPDGSRVYFISGRNPPGAYEVSITGGESRLVVAGANRMAPSPDGKWLAYLDFSSTLHVRPIEGGTSRKLLAIPAGQIPVWSPDSTRLLVLRGGEAQIVSIADGKATPSGLVAALKSRRLLTTVTELRGWFPDGRVLFCSPVGVAANLWTIPLSDVAGATPEPVTLGPGNTCDASASASRLVFAYTRAFDSLHRIPVDHSSGRVRGELTRVSPEGASSILGSPRPDDSRIAYVTRTGDGQAIYVLDEQAGGALRQIVPPQPNISFNLFSADGSRIFFGSSGPKWTAYSVSPVGGESQLVGDLLGRPRGASPDGRYLLTWQFDPKWAVGVFDLITRKAATIVSSDKYQFLIPVLSPDGRWLAFTIGPPTLSATDLTDLYIAPFRGSQPIPESEWQRVASRSGAIGWSPDLRSLYALEMLEIGSRIIRIRLNERQLSIGQPEEIYSLRDRMLGYPAWNVPWATRNYLYASFADGQSEIWTMSLPSR